jgi:peptide/nickel transport system ATP-binding protein
MILMPPPQPRGPPSAAPEDPVCYQNPFASLDPRQTLFEIIEEPLNFFSPRQGGAKARVETVAQRVALPVELLTRTAGSFQADSASASIARALILADHSGAGRSHLRAGRHRAGADPGSASAAAAAAGTYLFITHDLSVRRIAHSVTVLRSGQVVEHGDVETLFRHRRTTIPAS